MRFLLVLLLLAACSSSPDEPADTEPVDVYCPQKADDGSTYYISCSETTEP